MNKIKKLSVALCLCVCMVIGAVFVGCDNPEQTQEIENLQTQIEQLQTDKTNLNNQLEELQTENSQLKEVTAVDVVRGLYAVQNKIIDVFNAGFGGAESVGSESSSNYLGQLRMILLQFRTMDVSVIERGYQSNVVYY